MKCLADVFLLVLRAQRNGEAALIILEARTCGGRSQGD
jgi:hypothetical protein